MAARPSRRVLATLALVAAAVMAAHVWDGTRYPGPGLYGDGAGYLGAAESFARHDGLRVPFASYESPDSTSELAQWPPGFPVVLSMPLMAGVGPATAIRLVQSVVGACTVALTAVVVATATAPVWGAMAAVAMLVTPAVVAVHLNVVSEPLYLFCLAVMLWLMVSRPGRPGMYGVVASAAVLVRYLGLAAIAAAGLWAVMQPGGKWVRARRAAFAMVPGLAVRWIWSAYIQSAGGSERPMHVDHGVGVALRQLAGATGAWLAPWDFGGGSPAILHGAQAVFKVILGVALVAAFVAEVRTWPVARRTVAGAGDPRAGGDPAPEAGGALSLQPGERLLAASTILVACHVAALLGARLLYSDVAFYDRVLSPVHYLLIVAAVTLIALRWPGGGGLLRAAFGVLGVVWALAGAAATGHLVRIATTVGLDHANIDERRGATIEWLRAHGEGEPIYANEPAKVFFHLQRDSRSLPWVLDADTTWALARALRARPGLVVWFTGGTAASFVAADLVSRAATPAKLEAGLPLRVVARNPDGVVWELDTRVRP